MPDRNVPSERQEGGAGLAGLPLGEVPARRAAKRDDDKNARRWVYTRAIAPFFDRAVEAYLGACEVKALVFADMIGVDATTLSKMRAGERIIDSDHLDPLRRHRATAPIVLQGEAHACGLAVIVRTPTKLTIDRVRDLIVEEVLKDRTLRQVVIDRVAEREGIEVEDVEDVIEHGDAPGAGETMMQQGVGP